MEGAVVPTGARGCDWDPPGIMQLPLPLLCPAALCISFHQNPSVGCGDHTFVAEVNGISYALQSFFTTVAVLGRALAAQGEILSEAIIHQLQKSPLQTLEHAISEKNIFYSLFPIPSAMI